MQKTSNSSSNKNFELAALTGSAASILDLGAGRAFNKPEVGAAQRRTGNWGWVDYAGLGGDSHLR